MISEKIGIEKSWAKHLEAELSADYMKNLAKFVEQERKTRKVFPPKGEVFTAFSETPFAETKVVIVGQDPYHGAGQAHGLSFSVKPGIPIPPSLKNIYKELYRDLKINPPAHGYLKSWSEQGVLLLNAVLSVREGQAASHQKKGWETFTDKVIQIINQELENVVFMLWGNYAKKKGAGIDRSKHLVLESGHPSPLSVRYFLGNGHFSKANRYLEKVGKEPIYWQLPEELH